MQAEPQSLLEVASLVADGTGDGLNWPALEARAGHAAEQRALSHLHVVACIARVHRSHAADAEVGPIDSGRGSPDASWGQTTVAEDRLAPGARWGHLILLELLAQGSFGDVYRARDTQLEREVALKLLRRVGSEQSQLEARILDEGRTLARVRHPNVVTVHGVEAHDGRVGLWMELVRGRTLEEILQAQGPFGAREAALVGQELCCALAAVHAAGLVHRDIKAHNVMREQGGRLVLMDFGTGQARRDAAGSPDRLVGTPLYLAPEILAGQEATTQSDIYALGVLLYHLVTASYPIEATTLKDLRAAHTRGRVTHLPDVRADLPSAFIRVVERALDHDPNRRYESVGAMEAALAGALEIDPELVVSPTSMERASGAQARPPTAAAATPAETVQKAVSGTRHRPGTLTAITALAAAAALVTIIAYTGRSWDRSSSPLPDNVRSIAVLPLENLSSEGEYFADGLTDELITSLSRVAALKVTSRTSAMQFKGVRKPLGEIADALHVDAILEGSVLVVPGRPDGPAASDRVRVTARLVHAGTDTQIWTERFERDLVDVLALQSEITGAIADRIRVAVTPGERDRLAAIRQVDPAVYKLVLLGRHHVNAFTEGDLHKAIDYFEQAAARDPTYAPAYAGLADCYSLLGGLGTVPPQEALGKATAAATKALDLDTTLGEAFAARAFAHFFLAWDWLTAESEFRRALELNPGLAEIHESYANFLTAMGRSPEAIEHIVLAEQLDPLSANIARSVGWVYLFSGKPDEAAAQLQRTLDAHRDFVPALTLLGRAQVQQGRYPEAIAALTRAIELEGRRTYLVEMLGHAYAAAGMKPEADRILAELRSRAEAGPVSPYRIALIYNEMGQREQALGLLERAFEQRDATMVNLKTDPRFEQLRSHPRFVSLLRKMRFPS